MFISRELAQDSPLKLLTGAAGLEIYGQSLIHFSILPFEKLPDCDWIFFYSRNGVKFFFQGLDLLNRSLPPAIKLAAMGKGTAAALKKHTFVPDFVGSGQPEATARAFLKVVESQKVLFARAFHSARSVQNMLDPYINIIDLPVYKNEIKTGVDLPLTDYVVLTSSLNVDAYFQNQAEDTSRVYIAIGKPTAIRYAQWTSKKVYIPKQTSEESLAQLILDLEKNNETYE